MRIPSDDGGLGVMGRETDDDGVGWMRISKVRGSQRRCIHNPLPAFLRCRQTRGGRERVHLLQRALFLEATYLMREQRGFAEE